MTNYLVLIASSTITSRMATKKVYNWRAIEAPKMMANFGQPHQRETPSSGIRSTNRQATKKVLTAVPNEERGAKAPCPPTAAIPDAATSRRAGGRQADWAATRVPAGAHEQDANSMISETGDD